jgi:hypothetical protein
MIFGASAAGAAFLSAVRAFVHGRPSAALGHFFRQAAVFVSFFDVLGLSFLFVGIR